MAALISGPGRARPYGGGCWTRVAIASPRRAVMLVVIMVRRPAAIRFTGSPVSGRPRIAIGIDFAAGPLSAGLACLAAVW